MREKAGLVTGGQQNLCASSGEKWVCRRLPKKRGENVDDYELGYRGSGHEGLSIYSGMVNHVMVAEQKRTGHEKNPPNVTRWKHKFGFHNRGVQWDTPMSKWAGEGEDWIQLLIQSPPRKEDVMISLLKMMRQPTEKKRESLGDRDTHTRQEIDAAKQESSKTVVDWVNGQAKLKTPNGTIAAAQNLLWKWWNRGDVLLIGRYISCEEERTDTANVVWSKVTGLCCLWDGRCERGVCGARILIQVFHAKFGVCHNLQNVWTSAW